MGKSLKKVFEILVFAACLFVIADLFYMVIRGNYDPMETETVSMKTVEKSIDTDIFIIRDENVISENVSGTVVPLVSDGQRVAEGEGLVAVFGSEKDAADYVRKQEIDKEISRLETVSNAEKLNIRDIKSYDNSINEVFNTLVEVIESGNFSEINNYSYTARDKLTSRQISLGETVDTTEIINTLKSERNKLGGDNPRYITADNTGYFINTTDGYENTLKYSDVLDFTPEMVEKALNSEAEKSNVGKIGKLVDDFNWYMAASVTRNQVDDLKVGDTVKVRFENSALSDISASVAKINTDINGKVALILKSNKIFGNDSEMRIEKAKIITKTIKGYKINKEAIRTFNGINGVYILRGNLVNFRRISVLFNADDYVVARTYEDENYQKQNNSGEIADEERLFKKTLSTRRREDPQWIIDSEELYSVSNVLSKPYVKLFDNIIIKGSDVYDGRII